MAETYLTPTFQNATKPQAQTPTGATAPAAPAQTGGEQYRTPTFQNAVKPPPPAPPPTAAPLPPVIAPSPVAPDLPGSPRNPNTSMPAQSAPRQTPPSAPLPPPPAQPGWGIDWSRGGEVTMPQSAQDWSTIAAQNSSMGLAGLKTQADAARARLGPVAAGSADLVGGAISPSTLLNAVPLVGPELAGGLHEGVKSYMEGNDWKTIGEDTLGGAGAGLAGQGAAALAPRVLPQLTRQGLNAGLAYGAHKLFGGWAGGDLYKEGAGLLGLYGMTDKLGERAADLTRNVANSPATQQAVKNLFLGAGSAARQQAGPYDMWVPGQ